MEVGVRKGAWTSEEDILLRHCIHKFGEGKWHLVPLRAGLNRCRKSCRLRWLNYLRPNIKRGYFGNDEVDLIVRMHKLLGNRWSLIAGRLPGRTANDVKNFWNTHISKKLDRGKSITKSNIVRPRPRNFSNSSSPLISHEDPTKTQLPSSSLSAEDQTNSYQVSGQEASLALQEDVDECIRWWGDLLNMTQNGQDTPTPFVFPNEDPHKTESTFLGHLGSSSANQDGSFSDLEFDQYL